VRVYLCDANLFATDANLNRQAGWHSLVQAGLQGTELEHALNHAAAEAIARGHDRLFLYLDRPQQQHALEWADAVNEAWEGEQ
jgi:hypothetical protein